MLAIAPIQELRIHGRQEVNKSSGDLSSCLRFVEEIQEVEDASAGMNTMERIGALTVPGVQEMDTGKFEVGNVSCVLVAASKQIAKVA